MAVVQTDRIRRVRPDAAVQARVASVVEAEAAFRLVAGMVHVAVSVLADAGEGSAAVSVSSARPKARSQSL